MVGHIDPQVWILVSAAAASLREAQAAISQTKTGDFLGLVAAHLTYVLQQAHQEQQSQP